MEDWATVALAMGPASIAGLVGYFAARFQRDTARAETRAATQRLQLDHRESERQRRRDIYRDFLAHLDRYDVMLVKDGAVTPEDQADWLQDYYRLAREISLCGDDKVVEQLDELMHAYTDAGDLAIERMEDGEVFIDSFRTVYPEARNDLNERAASLTDAMRGEVAQNA